VVGVARHYYFDAWQVCIERLLSHFGVLSSRPSGPASAALPEDERHVGLSARHRAQLTGLVVDVLDGVKSGHGRQAHHGNGTRGGYPYSGAHEPAFVDGPSVARRAKRSEFLGQIQNLASRQSRHRSLVLVDEYH